MTVSKTIKVKQGSKLEWFVRAEGFEEQSGVIDVVTQDTEFPIYLIGNTNNTSTLSFNYTPDIATVKINDVVGSSQKIRKGLTANWEVSADRYYSQSGTTDRMYSDLEIPIDLVGPHVILSINTNKSNYTVKINGVEGNNQWVLKGTKATYSVELYGYETISGTTDELYEDTTLDFTMRKAPYDLKDATYWSSSSSEFSGFSIPGGYAAWDYWTMNLNRRAFLASAEANTNYWNDSYYGVIDIHFKNGSSWLSRSRNNDTITYTSTTVNEKSSGSGYRYRKYKNIGICNPYRELSHVYFDHWHFSSKGDIDTSASLTSLLGYWANTMTINTNIPATITIDGNVHTNVTTAEFYTLADEIDDTREIAYSIEAEGYMPQSGTLVLDKDVTLDIVLEELYPVTFTINPTPADATVIINGEERNTIEIMQLEEVNWEVNYLNYYPQSGSMTMYENTVKDINLNAIPEYISWSSKGSITADGGTMTADTSKNLISTTSYNFYANSGTYQNMSETNGPKYIFDKELIISQITYFLRWQISNVNYYWCGIRMYDEDDNLTYNKKIGYYPEDYTNSLGATFTVSTGNVKCKTLELYMYLNANGTQRPEIQITKMSGKQPNPEYTKVE